MTDKMEPKQESSEKNLLPYLQQSLRAFEIRMSRGDPHALHPTTNPGDVPRPTLTIEQIGAAMARDVELENAVLEYVSCADLRIILLRKTNTILRKRVSGHAEAANKEAQVGAVLEDVSRIAAGLVEACREMPKVGSRLG